MRQFCLYLAMKKILEQLHCEYSPITYGVGSATNANAMQIDIRGGTLPRARVISTGEYLRRADVVYMKWRVSSLKEDILKAASFGTALDEKMETTFDTQIVIDRTTTRVGYDANNNLIYAPLSEDDEDDPLVANAVVTVIRVEPQSRTYCGGRTPQGLTLYTDSFLIEYAIEKEAQVTQVTNT